VCLITSSIFCAGQSLSWFCGHETSCGREVSQTNGTPLFLTMQIFDIVRDDNNNVRGEVCRVLPAFFVRSSRDVVVHSPLRHLKDRLVGENKPGKKQEIKRGFNPTYPGPLRGGRVCLSFAALLQSALITPHRPVSRKSSGGKKTPERLCFQSSPRPVNSCDD